MAASETHTRPGVSVWLAFGCAALAPLWGLFFGLLLALRNPYWGRRVAAFAANVMVVMYLVQVARGVYHPLLP